MIVLHDTEGWNGFVQELFEAKEKVELQHESLIRHQSGIAATLIGIIAVFGDMSQGSILLRCLTVASVLFLLLTVLAGVLYCFLQYKPKVESTLELLTAISRRLFGCCGTGFLTYRFMACQNLPVVVVHWDFTSIGKRSMCSTAALRLFFFYHHVFFLP